MINVHILTAAQDNYIYVLEEPIQKTIAVVDPTESAPVIRFLQSRKWPLHMILNTHHHHDHVGGNLELKNQYGAKVYCSQYDFSRVPGADIGVSEESPIGFGTEKIDVISVPGHTLGAISFYFSESNKVFTGDTLFIMGCGRLFEGTPEQMFKSLSRLAKLPDQTQLYCGHEYAIKNGEFASSIASSQEMNQYFGQLRIAVEGGHPSVPGTIGAEKRFNPFLKLNNVADFAQVRKQRDHF